MVQKKVNYYNLNSFDISHLPKQQDWVVKKTEQDQLHQNHQQRKEVLKGISNS